MAALHNRTGLSDVWPKRMRVADYRRDAFVGRGPSINTIKKNIDGGVLPGEKEGTIYYVWVNQHLQPERPPNHQEKAKTQTRSTGNELADAMISQFFSKQGSA